MGQVSSKLRRGQDCYFWHCPACAEMHPLPDSWAFNGNLESPTFKPSFKHTGIRFAAYTPEGIGIGARVERVCHYIVTDGQVAYCGDCWHTSANQTIPMPPLPPEYCD